MRTPKLLALAVLALLLLTVMSCTGNTVTQPSFDGERTVAGNGPNGPNGPMDPGGPRQPHGPYGPWGDTDPFAVDCVRLFDVDYVVELPGFDEQIDAVGEIKILDADCEADESDVRVKFQVTFPDYDHPTINRMMAGEKSLSDDGIVYTGIIERSRESKHHAFEMTEEFYLLVYPDPDDEEQNLIDGWYTCTRTDTWNLPHQDERQVEREWNFDISGMEVYE
jgi:hypothetical protein